MGNQQGELGNQQGELGEQLGELGEQQRDERAGTTPWNHRR